MLLVWQHFLYIPYLPPIRLFFFFVIPFLTLTLPFFLIYRILVLLLSNVTINIFSLSFLPLFSSDLLAHFFYFLILFSLSNYIFLPINNSILPCINLLSFIPLLNLLYSLSLISNLFPFSHSLSLPFVPFSFSNSFSLPIIVPHS